MELERHEVGIDVPSAIPAHVSAHNLLVGGASPRVGSAHNLLVGGASGPLSSLQMQTSLDHS